MRPRAFLASYTYSNNLAANKYSTMNISAAFNSDRRKVEREKERKASRVIVRGERMKFTELHIAVVTFHPLEFIFFLVCIFRRSHKRTKREKREEKEERKRIKRKRIS